MRETLQPLTWLGNSLTENIKQRGESIEQAPIDVNRPAEKLFTQNNSGLFWLESTIDLDAFNRLIAQAKERIAAGEFPDNEDGFIEALGLNPENYRVAGGGYDFLQALADTAALDWTEDNPEDFTR